MRKRKPTAYSVRMTPTNVAIGKMVLGYGWCLGGVSHGVVRLVKLDWHTLKVLGDLRFYVSDFRDGTMERELIEEVDRADH